LWSPASSKYLAKLLYHKGAAVASLAIDPAGRTMVTGGVDRQVKVWDLRMYKQLHTYYTVAGVPISLDVSQQSIVLGSGHAGHATFWSAEALLSKVKDPYMHHALPRCGPVETLAFPSI
jgi:U3 small nucleolar RNA-associated protein 7